jgi:hypothetical protein
LENKLTIRGEKHTSDVATDAVLYQGYCGMELRADLPTRGIFPPEKLLRASLLQAFYSIRSERQLMERLEFDLLFRWFVGLGIDDPAWDHSVFSKNRDRLLEGEIAAKFLAAILTQPRVMRLLSSQHFSVDGTLMEAWASLKSLKPRDGGNGNDEPPTGGGRNAEVDFRHENHRCQ